MFKNTKKQGDWGLGVAISYFVTQSYTVSIPLTDSQDYDIVVDINDKLEKVQVKTTTYKSKGGNYYVSLTIKGGNQTFSSIKKFDNLKIDYVFIVTKDNDKYLIPSTSLGNSVTLNEKYDIFKLPH